MAEVEVPVAGEDPHLEGPGDDEPEPDPPEAPDVAEGEKKGVLNKKLEINARTLLAVVVVGAIGVGAYALGQRQGGSGRDGAAVSTTKKAPKDFVTFQDTVTGTKLTYPKTWTQLSTKELDPDIRLLVTVPDTMDSLQLRVLPLDTAITTTNVADVKSVTDAIVSAGKVEVLQQKAISLDGLPGYYYLYRFKDSDGQTGLHAQYFIFQGKKMAWIVLQALPEASFKTLAPVFDQIVASFKIAPGDAPDSLIPATVPSATSSTATSAPADPAGTTPSTTASPSSSTP